MAQRATGLGVPPAGATRTVPSGGSAAMTNSSTTASAQRPVNPFDPLGAFGPAPTATSSGAAFSAFDPLSGSKSGSGMSGSAGSLSSLSRRDQIADLKGLLSGGPTGTADTALFGNLAAPQPGPQSGGMGVPMLDPFGMSAGASVGSAVAMPAGGMMGMPAGMMPIAGSATGLPPGSVMLAPAPPTQPVSAATMTLTAGMPQFTGAYASGGGGITPLKASRDAPIRGTDARDKSSNPFGDLMKDLK